MAELLHEWAGKPRCFHLAFGGVLDLEEAVSDSIGAIFIRVTGGRFRANDVYHTIRLGLIGGGLDALTVQRLMRNHFDARPYLENAALAGRILGVLMVGVEPVEDEADAEAAPRHKFSEVSQICRVFHMSPQELRDMRYADFVNMMRGFKAALGDKAPPHLTEDEFIDILERYEPEETAA